MSASAKLPFKSHRIYSRLLEDMHYCKRSFVTKRSGEIFRIVKNDQWATRDHLLSGVGSMKFGGRYNGPNVFRAAYVSFDVETSVEERLYYAKRIAAANSISSGTESVISDDFWKSYVLGTAKFELEVLDLSVRHVTKKLRVHRDFLVGEWEKEQKESSEALTQAIGRAACVSKIAAIVPSARRDGYNNFVMFPGNIPSEQEPTITDIQPLPKEFWRF